MRLNRESKTGYIKSNAGKIDIELAVATIGLTIGFVTVASSLINFVKHPDWDKLDYYPTYSKQIEAVKDVDIESKSEEILDVMGDKLNLVNQYNNATSDIEKIDLANQMNEDKKELKKEALKLIKLNWAPEMSGSVDNLSIERGDKNDPVRWRIKDEVNGVVVDNKGLTGREGFVIEAAIELEDYEYNSSDSKSRDKMVELYEEVIKQSAAYVAKNSEKVSKGK